MLVTQRALPLKSIWPSSQALKSVQSVLLQWENGDQASGSVIRDVGDGKIEFGESFKLPVILYEEKSRKSTVCDTYQKNNLEFHLYEPRKDKAVKSRFLASALINLADYGAILETTNASIPLNLKKSSKSSAQPVLYVNVQPCVVKIALACPSKCRWTMMEVMELNLFQGL